MNEEESNFTSLFIESVEDFIHQQNLLDQAKIAATVTVMEKGDFHHLQIITPHSSSRAGTRDPRLLLRTWILNQVQNDDGGLKRNWLIGDGITKIILKK